MSYIEFKNIKKMFGENTVLKDISIGVEKGQLVTLLGPSGCGKSTLLRCLAGLEDVTEGQIFLDGQDITNRNPKDRGIGMVFQQYSLFPNMTIEENVAFGLKMKKMKKEEIATKVEQMLTIVGLSDKKKSYPAQLSGGQQQRAALARAIVTEPKVLLLDEPLSAIDALLRRTLQIEIRRIQQELGITAIFVTHDQEEAMVMSDTIQLMYEGKIEQSGSPTQLYTRPATKFAATFMGHYNIMDGEIFNMLAKVQVENATIAFRPELLVLSPSPISEEEQGDYYEISGKVQSFLPHGNVLRYEINCNGTQIDADVLFEENISFRVGDELYMSIRKDACIYL